MPMSRAAAVVNSLKMDPAPSPTSENGCGCMVSPAAVFRPYVRLLAIATTWWLSLPGRMTLMTLPMPSMVGEAMPSIDDLTAFWMSGSIVVRIR